MTRTENIIYYTITAVVFIGIILCCTWFHTSGQSITTGGSERGSMTEIISTIVMAFATVVTATATVYSREDYIKIRGDDG